MPKVPDIKFDDITIAEEYPGGFKKERCKAGLWSIYNKLISKNA